MLVRGPHTVSSPAAMKDSPALSECKKPPPEGWLEVIGETSEKVPATTGSARKLLLTWLLPSCHVVSAEDAGCDVTPGFPSQPMGGEDVSAGESVPSLPSLINEVSSSASLDMSGVGWLPDVVIAAKLAARLLVHGRWMGGRSNRGAEVS